jgi:hypothetical protein
MSVPPLTAGDVPPARVGALFSLAAEEGGGASREIGAGSVPSSAGSGKLRIAWVCIPICNTCIKLKRCLLCMCYACLSLLVSGRVGFTRRRRPRAAGPATFRRPPGPGS